MTEDSATPGPWEIKGTFRIHVQGHPEPPTFVSIERAGGYVAGGGIALVRSMDDAQLIVHAVNAHAALVQACEQAKQTINRLQLRLSDAGAYGLPEDLSAFYNGTGVDGEHVQTCQALIAALAMAKGEDKP